mmetsp:Transcript_33257/g.91017  ORF Transcript_33257/g.91017 Transcript_33257/m.91017 type:complete len:250 (-) Transcript_33257:733-1482(-)
MEALDRARSRDPRAPPPRLALIRTVARLTTVRTSPRPTQICRVLANLRSEPRSLATRLARSESLGCALDAVPIRDERRHPPLEHFDVDAVVHRDAQRAFRHLLGCDIVGERQVGLRAHVEPWAVRELAAHLLAHRQLQLWRRLGAACAGEVHDEHDGARQVVDGGEGETLHWVSLLVGAREDAGGVHHLVAAAVGRLDVAHLESARRERVVVDLRRPCGGGGHDRRLAHVGHPDQHEHRIVRRRPRQAP